VPAFIELLAQFFGLLLRAAWNANLTLTGVVVGHQWRAGARSEDLIRPCMLWDDVAWHERLGSFLPSSGNGEFHTNWRTVNEEAGPVCEFEHDLRGRVPNYAADHLEGVW